MNQKSSITVKVALIVLCALSAAFVFLPTVTASVFGMKMDITIMNYASGKISGVDTGDGNPLYYACLILPIVAAVLVAVPKFAEDMTAKIVSGCTGANIGLMLVFLFEAMENLGDYFGFAFWFFVHVVVIVLILLLAGKVAKGKASMEDDVMSVFKR